MLAPEHWGLHGGAPADTCSTVHGSAQCTGPNAMAQRNYACDNFVRDSGASVGKRETGEGAG